MEPLLNSIKKLVRPPTGLTRRKQLEIKAPLPRELFEDLMKPLAPEDTTDLKRDAAGRLIPTKVTGSLRHYDYKIRKGSVTDRLFKLESLDPVPRAPRKAPAGQPLQHKRGLGCARARLSKAARPTAPLPRCPCPPAASHISTPPPTFLIW